MMKNESMHTQRVVAEMTREQMDLMDRIGKDALYSTGYKLSRNKIICALTDMLMELNINGKGLKDEMDLKQRIIECFRRKIEVEAAKVGEHSSQNAEVTPRKIMMQNKETHHSVA